MSKYSSFVRKIFHPTLKMVQAPIFVSGCLLAIALAGALLRVYKLGEWSFWGDEMFTVGGREDGFNYNFLRQSLSLFLIQKITATWGVNEWNARIVPALIGVISIPALFFSVKNLFGTRTALFSALLLSLSPWHIYWSQNARFYTALLLFYCLALYCFYWGMERDKPWYLVLCLVFLGMAVKERLLALFFVPVALFYGLFILLFRFEKPKGWRLRNVAIFAVPGLVASVLFVRPYLLNLPAWLSGFGFSNNSLFWLAGGFAFYVGLPVVALGSVGGGYLMLQKNRAGLLLSISAIVPILTLLVISPFHYTANRYAFISLISWLVLAAYAMTAFFEKTNWPVTLFALGTLGILLVTPISEDILYYTHQNGNRENWKAAFAYIQAHQQPEDQIISGNPQIANYYLSRTTVGFEHLELDETLAEAPRTWFVEDMASVQKFPTLHNWLIENTRLVAVEDVTFQTRIFRMRVYLFVWDSPGSGGIESGK